MNRTHSPHFSKRQLRLSSQVGWIDATGDCGIGVDKAGLDAIAPIIGGVAVEP